MIKVSTQARKQVEQMMQSDGYDISDSFVRVGVKNYLLFTYFHCFIA